MRCENCGHDTATSMPFARLCRAVESLPLHLRLSRYDWEAFETRFPWSSSSILLLTPPGRRVREALVLWPTDVTGEDIDVIHGMLELDRPHVPARLYWPQELDGPESDG